MAAKASAKSARELVKEKFPHAYVNDDGEWVYIQNKKVVTEPCPHCRQQWTHLVPEPDIASLGSGNCEENAWKNAAKALGLV